MSKFAVVYWSGTGNTEQMANAVAEGIAAAGGQAEVFTAADFGPDKVPEYEGLAFGCPSMGSEELESDEFEPMFRAVEPSLAGKKVGLFGSYGWGDGEWMRTWQASVEGDGCIIPNYLTPPVHENTEYYYFTNKPENFVLFKADGDQDRPNLK